jgi:hypothetical protein
MEGAFEGNDMELFGVTLGEVVAPRRLDGAFQCFRTRIGEKHLVGEGRLGQPAAEAFLSGNLIEIGEMPDLVGLILQRRNEVRVGMAERIDRNAGGKIEIAGAILRNQPDAFAALEP